MTWRIQEIVQALQCLSFQGATCQSLGGEKPLLSQRGWGDTPCIRLCQSVLQINQKYKDQKTCNKLSFSFFTLFIHSLVILLISFIDHYFYLFIFLFFYFQDPVNKPCPGLEVKIADLGNACWEVGLYFGNACWEVGLLIIGKKLLGSRLFNIWETIVGRKNCWEVGFEYLGNVCLELGSIIFGKKSFLFS